MADMEEIMGGVDPNVQPQDNPDPAKAGQPAEQPSQQSIPAPTRQAAPEQAPAPAAPDLSPSLGSLAPTMPRQPAAVTPGEDAEEAKTQKRIDEVISKLSQSTPKSAKKEIDDTDAELNDLISSIKGGQAAESDSLAKGTRAIESSLEGDTFWGGYLRNQKENAKVLITKVRAQLENDPAMKAGIFGQMYGAENVRQGPDGSYQFRPEGKRKWRDIDAVQSDAFTDFFTTNVLKAVPMVANMLTQVGGSTAMGLSLPAQVAAGAAGGAVEGGITEGIKSAVDPLLGIDPEREDLLSKIAVEAGYNAVAPVAFRTVGGVAKLGMALGRGVGNQAARIPGVKAAANTIADALAPATSAVSEAFAPQLNPGEVAPLKPTTEDINTLKQGKYWNQKFAQVREGFNSFREVFFPGSMEQVSQEVGPAVVSALDVAQNRLGKNIDIYKNEAIALANQTGKKSPMSNGAAAISDILQKNGLYYKDAETGLMEAVEGADRDLVQPSVSSAMDKMATLYNRIQKSNVADNGTDIKRIFNDLNLIDPLAKFNRSSATPAEKDAASMWKRVYGSLTADRDELMNGLFEEGSSKYASQWKADFKQFSQNADAIFNVKSEFHSPQRLQNMVDAFAKSSTEDKNELVDNIGMVLGKDSQEFRNFKGAVVGDLFDKFSKGGRFDTAQMLTFMNNKHNAPFIDRILEPKEKAILNNMVVGADQATQRGVLSASNKDKLVRGTGWLSSHANDGYAGAKQTFQMLKGDVATVDWMRHEGFAEAAKHAESEGMKRRILEAKSAMDSMIPAMAIIDVPVFLKDGTKKITRRYAPYAGPALAKTMEAGVDDLNQQ